MNPSPDLPPAADEAAEDGRTLAALSLRAATDLPPDFAAGPEIDEVTDDDDEG